MLQLLKVEWLKVKNYTTFWVLSVLYLISLFGANYITYSIWLLKPKKSDVANALIGNPFKFPDVWHTVSYTCSFLMFLPGLLTIISFTNEYSFKTHRQNIIDGWSRRQFILVKIALTAIIAFLSSLTVFFIALGFGLHEDAQLFTFEQIEFVGYFFIQALSYCAVALLFGQLFKRSGIAIGVYFLYTLILENMLAGFLNHYTDYYGRYLPLETTDNLIPLPVFRAIVSGFLPSYNITALLIMSAIYLALYYTITIYKFQNDDL